MKLKLVNLSRRYSSALRKHLKQGPQAGMQTARRLGQQAVVYGLGTLDLARIHEGALATLERSRDGILKEAERFFAEALTAIEETHRAALEANALLKQVNQKLRRRTAQLAASHRSLKASIAGRKGVDEDLRKSAGRSKKLLAEAHRLQRHLRGLTHRLMMVQEARRKQSSRDLEDEIAQTLLGINVRLLTLKKAAAANDQGFKKDIASAQRLVDDSVKSIKRFASEFGQDQEA
jgi:signal transduction histidine kinase